MIKKIKYYLNRVRVYTGSFIVAVFLILATATFAIFLNDKNKLNRLIEVLELVTKKIEE